MGPGLLLVRGLGTAPYNLPDDRVIGPIHLNSDGSHHPAGVAEFDDPESAIVTAATNGALPAGSISDSATLSGDPAGRRAAASCSELWDNATCSGDPLFTSVPVPVHGQGPTARDHSA